MRSAWLRIAAAVMLDTCGTILVRPYLKLAYIVGVVRFGIKYYVGVGFSHEKQPPIAGPQCTDYGDGFNYPCAFAVTPSPFLATRKASPRNGEDRFSDEDAFGNITGGGQNGVSEYKTSQDSITLFTITMALRSRTAGCLI